MKRGLEVIRRDPPIAQGSTTLMLEADYVSACYQAMKKKDWLIFLEDLADRPYGIRCFRLLDPNKNDIVNGQCEFDHAARFRFSNRGE